MSQILNSRLDSSGEATSTTRRFRFSFALPSIRADQFPRELRGARMKGGNLACGHLNSSA